MKTNSWFLCLRLTDFFDSLREQTRSGLLPPFLMLQNNFINRFKLFFGKVRVFLCFYILGDLLAF